MRGIVAGLDEANVICSGGRPGAETGVVKQRVAVCAQIAKYRSMSASLMRGKFRVVHVGVPMDRSRHLPELRFPVRA